MLIEMVNKQLHVMCGVAFLGLIIANYFYITQAVYTRQAVLLRYALKTSFWLDAVVFPFIVFQFISAEFLIEQSHLSLSTPWIKAAYMILGITTILWGIIFCIKMYNYLKLNNQHPELFFSKLFHVSNSIAIILVCLIIHDAVMHSTFVPIQ
jgi:uncharacterized membrane protein